MKLVETPGLIPSTLDLQATRDGVRGGVRGPGLSRPQPALGQPQRIPAKANRIQTDQGRTENAGHGQRPAPWGQGP